MLRHIRLLVAFVCATIYSVANALQPTVRAGSISMTNNTIKPASGNTILTTSTTKATSNNTTRPSALSKFTPTTVVSAPSSGGGNVSSSVLTELQQQINDLRSAQLGLEQNQITRDDVENTIESQIKSLDLTTTNRDLKDTLSEIRSTTQGLSTSLTSIQQITDNYTESLNSDIDNRLKVRGILDANNEVTFAKKIDIEPDILAQKIVTNTDATTTLANSIQPKESEIRDIVTNELTDVGVLKDGELNVEKKGQVVVSEETVTNALRNSQNFKNMVSEEITAKGYVTESALNEKNFINSDAIQNLATKDEITPTAIAAAIADDAVATATLSGKIGPDVTEVNTIVTAKLKEKGILNPEENLQVATKDEIANLDSKFALKGEVGTDENAVKELISKDLYERGIVNDQGTLTIATDEKMAELSDAVEKLDNTINGDIDTPDSLLHKIKNNDNLRNALKGADGESASATDIAHTLKNDSEFLQSVKGDKGEAGSGFSFKGNVSSTSDLPSCNTNTQSLAYYNTTDALLYICSCTDDTCEYNGVPFKGEKGEDGNNAKSIEQAYCESNFEIVQALYPTVQNTTDCANSSKFSFSQYSAIQGGANAYCLSLTQNPLDLTSGIGKKLVATFGTDKMTAFNSAPNAQSRIKMTGFTASSIKTNATFMEACEARYSEIMSGDDGKAAETVWHAYCEADAEGLSGTKNLTLIKKLYPSKAFSNGCDDFTQTEYAAIIGGAESFCMSLTKNFSTMSLNDGIGLRMAKLYATKNSVTLDAAKTQLNSVKTANIIDRFDASKKLFGTTSLNQACIDNYNAIMSGDDGSDGKSAAETWCEAHLMKNNTVSVRLSPAKMTRAYDKIKGISAYAGKIEIGSTSGEGGYFTDMNACLAAVAADPDLMGGESEADQKFNELQKETIQKGGFTLSDATSALSTHRASFRDTYLKGQNGQDGTTFTPSFNSTTGQLSWTSSKSGVAAPSTMKIAKTDSEMNTLIDTKTNNAIGSQAVTMNDLVNYINAGLFKVGENAVTLNTNFTTSGLSSGETVSLQKLSGAGNSSDSTKRIGTVSSGTCSGGVCSVEKSAAFETNTDYNYPTTPLFNQP